ncbi:unnamed protein product, partial [Meganyctiphanes norvegica]
MFKYVAAAKILKKHKAQVDNAVFHLHYRVTFLIFLISSMLVTAKEFLGTPIQCLAGKGVSAKVLNTYCWIMSTFSLPSQLGRGEAAAYEGLGQGEYDEEPVYHAYYQWVPFVLLLQAVMFYVPRYLWKCVEGGVFQTILGGLDKLTLDDSTRMKKHKILAKYMINHLHMHRNWTIRFFLCEALCLVNVVGNIYFTDFFLGGTFMSYGSEVINFPDMDPETRVDPMMRIFPRVAKCTFRKYGPSGSLETHDAMCVLALNIINEKIYIFVWFWLIFMTVITSLWLIYRLAIISSSSLRFKLLQVQASAGLSFDSTPVRRQCFYDQQFLTIYPFQKFRKLFFFAKFGQQFAQ